MRNRCATRVSAYLPTQSSSPLCGFESPPLRSQFINRRIAGTAGQSGRASGRRSHDRRGLRRACCASRVLRRPGNRLTACNVGHPGLAMLRQPGESSGGYVGARLYTRPRARAIDDEARMGGDAWRHQGCSQPVPQGWRLRLAARRSHSSSSAGSPPAAMMAQGRWFGRALDRYDPDTDPKALVPWAARAYRSRYPFLWG
jgi:hypothetical protein